MSFFNKKQEVIDIKLTQFGKNLLARGAFKPYYYRFFDDGVLYNSDCAGIRETQKQTEERLKNTQYLKTQYLVTGVEERFEQNQNLINSGSIKTFMEIKRRQDPLLADKILKYPLQNTKINSPKAPSYEVRALDTEISSSSENITIKGISFDVPQIHFSSSYELLEDRRNHKDVPPEFLEYQTYIDLMANRIEFLDKTEIEAREENVIIKINELNVESFLENFEIEIYEIDEKENLIRLNEQEVEKYFEISIDEEIEKDIVINPRDERFYPGRNK